MCRPAVNHSSPAHNCRYRVGGEGGWETGYRWDPSRVLVDPYARHVAGRREWATRDEFEDFQTTVRSRGGYGTKCWPGLRHLPSIMLSSFPSLTSCRPDQSCSVRPEVA